MATPQDSPITGPPPSGHFGGLGPALAPAASRNHAGNPLPCTHAAVQARSEKDQDLQESESKGGVRTTAARRGHNRQLSSLGGGTIWDMRPKQRGSQDQGPEAGAARPLEGR